MSAHHAAAAISVALAERIEQLVTELIGASPTYRCRHELRWRDSGSLVVTTTGRGAGLFCDHAAGDAGGDALDLVRHVRGGTIAEALLWAIDWLGATPSPPEPLRPRPPSAVTTISAWPALWAQGRAISDTSADKYLRSRGLLPPAGDVFRFHPACPRERERLPAMLAIMTDAVTNQPVGIHRTFLRADGLGKIEHGKQKMMLGGAGVMRLAPDDEITLGLGICEGIETGLALMQRAGWGAVWAAGSAGGIARFPVLAGIESLSIFPDCDDSGVSAKASEQCAARWREAGREVQVVSPPAGADWLDALSVRRAA
jgi:hypothetical protein